MDQHLSFWQWVGHTLSMSAILGTFLGILPVIAAIVAILWYVVQLYESVTVQRYLKRRRSQRIARHERAIERLKNPLLGAPDGDNDA